MGFVIRIIENTEKLDRFFSQDLNEYIIIVFNYIEEKSVKWMDWLIHLYVDENYIAGHELYMIAS